MTAEDRELASAQECPICAALILAPDRERHIDWHERLIDEVIIAVKIRLLDPPT